MHAYLQLMLERFDCYGTWLPGAEIHVGEIGELIGNGSFSHTGELADRIEGAPAINRVAEGPKQALVGATASRGGGASLRAGQMLQALADASASLTLKVNKQNSVALLLDEVTRHQFADERQVRRLMQTLWERGDIGLNEVVVTYVLEAASGFVAASSSSELAGDGGAGVEVGFSEFQLGKVEGKLAIVSRETSELMSVAEEDRALTPMYRALVFRGSRPWLKFWRRHYTVEALIEADASLRAMGRRRHWSDVPPVDAIDVVSSARPSLALAEQTLAALDGAAGLPVGIDVQPAGRAQLVKVYDNFGRSARIADEVRFVMESEQRERRRGDSAGLSE